MRQRIRFLDNGPGNAYLVKWSEPWTNLRPPTGEESVLRRRLAALLVVAALSAVLAESSFARTSFNLFLGGPAVMLPAPPPVVVRPAPVVTYSYMYYPDCQVYYAPERRVYYWQDGPQWAWGPVLPPAFILGPSVSIRMDSDRPYIRHRYYVEHYPPRWHRSDWGERRWRDRDGDGPRGGHWRDRDWDGPRGGRWHRY